MKKVIKVQMTLELEDGFEDFDFDPSFDFFFFVSLEAFEAMARLRGSRR